MPNAAEYLEQHKAMRVLIVGDPGHGKSSAIAHLAESDLIDRIFYLDIDGNMRGPLNQLSKDAKAKFVLERCRDKVKFADDKKWMPVIKGVPNAFPKLVRMINNWSDSISGEVFGAPEKWTERDCLVVDGCSGLARISMYYEMFCAGRMGLRRRMLDWQRAIERFQGVVDSLNNDLPCHVLMTAHLARLSPETDESDDDEDTSNSTDKKHTRGGYTAPENFWKRYPVALGQKLPPKLGGDFETVLQAKRVGHGDITKYVIKTKPDEDVDIKIPVAQQKIGQIEVPNTQLIDIFKKVCQT